MRLARVALVHSIMMRLEARTCCSGPWPAGDSPVQGWEAAALRSMREALGLADSDAATAHMEVGRRLFRKRMEEGDDDDDTQSRREFQKLVFISTRTFGEKQAKFLLPWKRMFRVSDAQVALALKTSASGLFKTHLTTSGAIASLDPAALAAAKQCQAELFLGDDDAAEMVQEMTQAHVAAKVEAAIELASVRSVNKDTSKANNFLKEVLAYNSGALQLETRVASAWFQRFRDRN